ncbi:MAG: sulfatase [Planctomycetota bacterium]
MSPRTQIGGSARALAYALEALLLVSLVRIVGPLVDVLGRPLGPTLEWSSALGVRTLWAPVLLGALAGGVAEGRSRVERLARAAFAAGVWLAWAHLAQPDLERKRTLALAAGAACVHVVFAPALRWCGGLGSGFNSGFNSGFKSGLGGGAGGARGAGSSWRWRAPLVLALAGAVGSLPGLRARLQAPRLAPEGRFNLVLVTVDTVRQDALGCYGNPLPTSPHLDALAADGVLFEDALSQAPHTHASIASLLTSTYPIEHRSLRESQRLQGFNETLAERLSARGYQTAAFLDNPWLTREFGFDQGYADFAQHARPGEAEAWLAAHADAPFFLHVHLLQPHAPYEAVAPWAREFQPDWPADAPYQREVPIEVLWDAKRFADVTIPPEHLARMRALYASEVRALDEQLGALLAALDATGRADETLVVVASDHGEEFLEHGSVGHSHSLYQELVRVPLIMRLPRAASLPRGVRVREQAQLIDVAPTVLDILGVSPLPRARGGSWLPALEGRGAAPESALLGVSQVYRVNSRHLLLASTRDWTLHALVAPLGRDRFDDWELSGPEASDFVYGTRFQLFSRVDDPGEQRDLARERPEVVGALTGALEAWRAVQMTDR